MTEETQKVAEEMAGKKLDFEQTPFLKRAISWAKEGYGYKKGKPKKNPFVHETENLTKQMELIAKLKEDVLDICNLIGNRDPEETWNKVFELVKGE